MFRAKGLFRRNIPSIVTLIVGAVVFLSIPSQIVVFDSEGLSSVNAQTVPYLITSLIVVISFFMIVFDAFAHQNEDAAALADKQAERTQYGSVLLAFLSIALWIVILPYLGFVFSTILLVSAVMLIIGNCRWWQIALLSVILSVPIDYLLAAVLRVYLPSGSLFG